MALESVGYYALPVIPSFEGMDRQVNASMGKAFGGLGKKLGLDLGNNIGAGLKKSESAIKSAANSHVAALDKVSEATGKVTAAQAKLDAARSNAASRAQAVATAERRLNDLRKSGSATDRQKAAAEREVSTARERARNAGAQAVSIEQRVTSARRAETTATREAKRAEQELADARKANARGGGLAGFLGLGGGGGGGDGGGGGGAGLAAAGGLARAAGMGVGKMFLGGVGVVLTATSIADIGKGLVGVLGESVKTGLAFERNLNTIQGVTGATNQEMARLSTTARQLGSDTKLAGTTAGDAALAMGELAKAGFTVDQSIAASRGTLQLATAAQIDAADAATILGSAINTFQLQASDAGRVTNDLAAAANASSIDIPDLALAMQQGGSVAAGFGMSIEDTIATLATFAQMGVRGSDAGTLMKTSLLSTLDPTDKQATAMEELNLQLTDANGNFVGYREMMRQLSEASKRMTQEQFNSAAATIYGSDAVRASMFAAGNAVPVWDQMRVAQEDQGAAARMAAANMQGLPGVVEGIGNSWEDVKLSVYDALDGMAQALGKEGVGALSGFGDYLRNHQPEMIAFFTTIGHEAVGMARAIVQGVGAGADALAIFVNGIGDTMAAVNRGYAATQRLLGRKEEADKFDALADKQFGMADSLYAVKDGAWAAEQRLDKLDATLGKAGTDAQNTAEMARALGEGVKAIPDGKRIVVDSNTPEVQKRLRDLGFEVKRLPDGTIEIVAKDQKARDAWDAYRRSVEDNPPEPEIKPTIDPEWAKAEFNRAFGPLMHPNIGDPNQQASDPFLAPPAPGGPPGLTGPPRAFGGIFAGLAELARFANGGNRLPDQAVIQPAAGAGLVQWAEAETEGEAFIPLSKRKRQRSRRIWAETGKRLGVEGFADGGFLTRDDIERIGASFGLDMTSGHRDEAGSFHSTDQAADMSNGVRTDQMLAFATYMAQNYGAQLKELIYDDPRFKSEIDEGKRVDRSFFANAGDHTNHVHVATKGMAGQTSGLAELASLGGGGSPSMALGGRGGPSLASLSSSASPDDVGAAVIQEALARGYSQDEAVAIASTMFQESGGVMQQGGGGAWHGFFQQDSSYPNRDDPAGNVRGFLDRLDAKRASGGASGDIWKDIFWLQQAPGAGSANAAFASGRQGYLGEIQSQRGRAQALLGRAGPSLSTSANGYAQGVAGIDPETGERGYYTPDPKAVREKQDRLADLDADIRQKEADVRVQEQQVTELKSDASQSQRMAAENQAQAARDDLAKLNRERGEAEGELADAQRGKFKASEKGKSGSGGESELGGIGSIMSSFLKDTFGLGDLFPDPSQLGVVKLASAIMGIKYTPQGTGFKGGLLEGLPWAQEATDPNNGTMSLAPGGGAADSGGGGALPFGMIPGISSVLPTPMPDEPHGLTGGGPPGPPQPMSVDQSTHVTVQNPQMTEASNAALIRRTVLKTPRLGTYQAAPGVMGT